MLISAAASVLFSVLPGFVAFDLQSVLFVTERCLEIAVLTAFAVLPILAVAASQKGYIFPVCMLLLYVSSAFHHFNQYVPASCVQHFRNHCEKWKYPRSFLCTEHQCSADVVLHPDLGCVVRAVCWVFAEQKEVR